MFTGSSHTNDKGKLATFVEMNLLRFLLAFYFMALSLMPCEDVHKESGSAQTQLSFTTDDSHSKDKGDICSPLCVCNCCQMTVAAFKMTVLLEVPVKVQSYFSKKILFHTNGFAYQVYDHIWQPPKI
ncbi:hypothetical protein CHA01nite_07220 [Chryseobacterium hagamense]|uniref:Uncharacterized protein n=2 Tax=Chryseobacterium hagamense TaxID=395935 RepID=A0A511YIG5_9FLAO|nr:hypothetical protein CHA01nite_07220 [Chryseobacterium hagamense]